MTPLLASIALTACGNPESNAAFDKAQIIAQEPKQVAAVITGRTVKDWTRPHGTQIEHLAADGRTFLWYPGNARILPGYWKVEKRGRTSDVCFLYGPMSHNPVTGQRGGKWHCAAAAYYLVSREEIVAGDPLNLKQRLPFVMPAQVDMSIAQAMAKAGLGGLSQPNTAMLPRLPASP